MKFVIFYLKFFVLHKKFVYNKIRQTKTNKELEEIIFLIILLYFVDKMGIFVIRLLHKQKDKRRSITNEKNEFEKL